MSAQDRSEAGDEAVSVEVPVAELDEETPVEAPEEGSVEPDNVSEDGTSEDGTSEEEEAEEPEPPVAHPEIPDIDADGRPGLIPTEAFASRGQLGTSKVAPDGRHFAYLYSAGEISLIQIVDADTRSSLHFVPISGSRINWFRWANGDRLLISVRTITLASLFGLPSSKLKLFDLTTGELRDIELERQGYEGDDILYLDPAGEYAILSASSRAFRSPAVWRVPLAEGGNEQAERILSPRNSIDEWWADDTGVVRLGMKITPRGSRIFYYRATADGDFERVSKINTGDDEGDYWDVLGIFAGSDTGYALVEDDDGHGQLREFNYSTGEPGPVVYADPEWGLDAARFDPSGRPMAVQFTDDKRRVEWLDEDIGETQAALSSALGGGDVEIISMSSDKGRMLVLHSSAGDPGALYVFTPGELRLDLFANLRPEIDHRLLAEPRAISYTARDGLELRAFLTMPRGRGESGLPLILMPHGGPYGIRDSLEYNDWVQVLANRGYAVLQPNYRGSGGYGKAFEELGDGQIGRTMQDDLDDARAWAVAEGIADPARVCLVGASYGGYAALWAVIRNPELYACAASFAGVTDFEEQLNHDFDYLARRYRRDWKRRVEGSEGNFDLDDVSPARQVARLTRPVLLAHGKSDYRVPFSQFEEMVEEAEEAGIPLQTLELKTGHNMANIEAEQEWYDTLMAFLAEHNPAD